MGLFGLSLALSTCLAASGSEMTKKLDAGPAEIMHGHEFNDVPMTTSR